jgi:hypothetical protein
MNKTKRAKAGDNWDESAHPRAPKGGAGGGQFAGGQTAGGIDQGEVGSGWHPEKDNTYAGRKPDEAKFGRSNEDFSLTDEDEQFVEDHGEAFVPVLNELFQEYDAAPADVENFMEEMNLSDSTDTAAADVLTAFHNSYVGTFEDTDAAAENFIHETYPRLPKAFTDAISRSDLSDSLFYNKGSPYAAVESDSGEYMVFKKPASMVSRTKDAKPLAFEVDSVNLENTLQLIGVNDDGAALVLDEGANIHRTADGYLAAFPRIARTGIQVYRGYEMGAPDKDKVRIYRPESEVFAPDSLRSYAHKPVTNDHPKEAVTKDNWRKYAVGNMADEIMRDGGFVRIPMMISDGDAIQDVEDGKRELSLGYTMDLDMTPGKTEDGESYDGVMRNIRANHLALVTAARGGKELRVGDSGEGAIMKKIVVDGNTIEVDDVAAVIVPKHIAMLEKSTADAATALKVAQDKTAADTATIATLTAENATLVKKVADAKLSPQQIEQLVRDRAVVVTQARAVLPTVVTDSRELCDIRRQVVDAAMGAAAKGWNDEQVASSFAVLTKDVDTRANETQDSLRTALSQPGPRVDARDAAYGEYENKLTNAWKKPVAA